MKELQDTKKVVAVKEIELTNSLILNTEYKINFLDATLFSVESLDIGFLGTN